MKKLIAFLCLIAVLGVAATLNLTNDTVYVDTPVTDPEAVPKSYVDGLTDGWTNWAANHTTCVDYVCSRTDLWDQAVLDGIAWTNWLGAYTDCVAYVCNQTDTWDNASDWVEANSGHWDYVESQTSFWDNTYDWMLSVSGDVDYVFFLTGLWNNAAADASFATNWISTNTLLETYVLTNWWATNTYVKVEVDPVWGGVSNQYAKTSWVDQVYYPRNNPSNWLDQAAAGVLYHPLTTVGIADNNLVEVDGSPNDDEYARWTANGIEGRTSAETRIDLVVPTFISVWSSDTNWLFIVSSGGAFTNFISKTWGTNTTMRTEAGL